ncbi:hypothetical protein AB1K70_15225 [Bremerella sp. JC770]|uniref:hypothetical protein n=1 Tax=Bremerella sp. JC770 TaxID=3232137 RepID=UPI003458D746
MDDEPVQATLAEPTRPNKKDLAPTPVALAMVIGMFQSPLVPVATFWPDSYQWQPMGLSFLFSMLFLVKSPTIWWIGCLLHSGLLVCFLLSAVFYSGFVPPAASQYLGLVGIFTSGLILWMLARPSARKYYFRTRKTM